MPQDPSYYIDSCRRLSQEQKIVKKLQTNACTKNTNDTSKRNPINSSINCHNFVEKEIMLNNEQPSWCSRISPEQLNSIKQENDNNSFFLPDGNTTLFEGPLFVENDFKNSAAYDTITANFYPK
jgi:hypothetical protein